MNPCAIGRRRSFEGSRNDVVNKSAAVFEQRVAMDRVIKIAYSAFCSDLFGPKRLKSGFGQKSGLSKCT